MFLRHLFRRNFATTTAVRDLKPSIFTGKADFYETLYFLDDILLKTRDLKASPTQSIEFNWLNREKLQNKLGFEMSLLEYRQIRQRLGKIQNSASVSSHIMEFLRVFGDPMESSSTLSADSSLNESIAKKNSLGYVDELGRAVAVGKRKSSSSKVMLVPGSGEFMVNGRSLVDYFPRFRDIYTVAKPFQVIGQFGNFNVWSLAKSGGHTGQSGAIALGLAKALAVYNPEFKDALDAAGCLRRDPRRVERKKPGQEKARKKFTWVKR